jgi:hypothetical protein
VVGVDWYGYQGIKVVYEDGGGSPQSRLLFRNEGSSVGVADSEGPWSFDDNGALMRHERYLSTFRALFLIAFVLVLLRYL